MIIEKKSYWLKSGIYTLLQRFSVLIFGFGSVFILARTLTKDDFGAWVLFLAVTTTLELAKQGFIQNGVIKYLAEAPPENHAPINTASLFLNILFSFLMILMLITSAGFLSAWWDSPHLQGMFFFYIITIIVLIPFSQFDFIQQANFDFQGICVSYSIRNGLLFFYILICFFSGVPIELLHLVHAQSISILVGAIVSFFYVRRFFLISKNLDFNWVKKLFHYGKFVFATNLSSMVYKSIDQVMLGALISPAAVATYNIASRVTNLVEYPTTAIASIVFPKSAQRMQTQGIEGIRHLYEKSVGLILAIVIPCILVVLIFPHQIIYIIAGDKYLDAVPVLQLTILFGLFLPFSRQFGTILDATGKPQLNFYFVLIAAVLNIVLNYLFINAFGLMGAVYGTLVSYFITFVANQIIMARLYNVRFSQTLVLAMKFYEEGYHTSLGFIKGKWSKIM